jgi:hypothetical protein
MRRKMSSVRRRADSTPSFGKRLCRRLHVVRWHELLAGALLATTTISIGSADAAARKRISLPIEVLGADGTTVSRTVTLQADESASVRFLWLQIHGVRYAYQASVQVNTGPWIALNNDTVTIADPGKSFGGVGGFPTLVMTLPLPNGTAVPGANNMRFRFNRTDGVASGYRVLAWNFLTIDGRKIIPLDDFAKDAPETWRPPLLDAASIQAGQDLWQTASLVASSLPSSPRIQAHCADCHAQDGRDLKYFNYSNESIVARSCFHGLSTLQGEQIASYIRSLPFPNPGRPWNPPYQPGPGLDEQPTSSWAAGAGLDWVLSQDIDALQFLLLQQGTPSKATASSSGNVSSRELVGLITPDIFRPDGNLNPREIPISLQLLDWSHWLPRVHPKDAWGATFTRSEFAALYADKHKIGADVPLRTFLANPQSADGDIRPVVASFTHWSQSRRTFLRRLAKTRTVRSPALTDNIYSTQLWQLVKTWEIMQEFGLEGRGRDLIGLTADSRTWCNTIPAETSPSEGFIPDRATGVAGSELSNEYFSASWYELQILLNSGNHQHRDRRPIDWTYVIGRFLDLYGQTHQPEPTRLLVAVTKALQSTDPHMGPDNVHKGWRPDENIDPRIMISPVWAPIFETLPREVHRALIASLLAAWMDKNLRYSIAEYLPIGMSPRRYYTAPTSYGEVSGGKVWEAAERFRAAGVSDDLIDRLLQWGIAFTDRAERLQYH